MAISCGECESPEGAQEHTILNNGIVSRQRIERPSCQESACQPKAVKPDQASYPPRILEAGLGLCWYSAWTTGDLIVALEGLWSSMIE